MLVASDLSSSIKSGLVGDEASGPKRDSFCLALATGIVNALVGQTFQTTDSGSGSGGTGSGTGITGLSSSAMAADALATMTRQGPKASTMMNAIMAAVANYLASNTTLSTTSPVGVGSGTVIVGSFSCTIAEMTTYIDEALQGDGAIGPERTNFASSIATGVVGQILATGTGIVTISGSTGNASSGTGNGVIS